MTYLPLEMEFCVTLKRGAIARDRKAIPAHIEIFDVERKLGLESNGFLGFLQ